MNSNTTKILAVVVILVVIVAGAAAYLVMNKNSSSNQNKVKIDAALEVYGNADNDYKIDSNDAVIIQNIINKKDGYTLDKYPLADAYQEGDEKGVVNNNDLEQVKNIIAGGLSDGKQMKIWHINHTTDTSTYPTGEYVVDTKWPIKQTVANGAANALIIYEMVGIRDNIVGINYSSSSPPDSIVYKHYSEMSSLGTSTMYLTESLLAQCATEHPEMTAVITADNKGYLDGTKGVSETYIEESMNLDVIRIQHAAVDPNEYSSALLLLGFLFQKNTNAVSAAEWITKVYQEVTNKVSVVTTKVRVAATSYYNYLSARNSDYADVAVQAGGNYVLGEYSSSSVYFEDSGTHTADPDILKPENQPDVIICMRTSAFLGKAADGASWYGDMSKWNTSTMKSQLEHFKVFNCWSSEKVYTISGDMPIVARVLYSAAIMYPDAVSMDYANSLHQEFVDKFLGSSYKVSDCHFVLTQSEIENMKS